MKPFLIHHKCGEDLSQKGEIRCESTDSTLFLAGEVRFASSKASWSVVASSSLEVWTGEYSIALLKETCFQSRAVCAPFDSQVQPIFEFWGATDRPQTLLKAYGDAVEQQRKARRFANCLHIQAIPTRLWQEQSESKKDEVRLWGLFYATANITSNSACFQEQFGRRLQGFFLWH